MRPVPVAVILAAERVLLRADGRVYAWQARADNALTIGTVPDSLTLATAPATPGAVQMFGFVGDCLRYRVGKEHRELSFIAP